MPQEKYINGIFHDNLKKSKELVDKVVLSLKSKDLLVREEDDKNPFIDMNGRAIRLWDIMLIDPICFRPLFVEVKDFPRCYYYETTGLPKRYINERMMFANKGKDLFLIFQDCIEFIKDRAEKGKTRRSFQYVLDFLVDKGFARINEDKSIYFVPYGNKLDVLMRPENQIPHLEDKVKSRFNQYYQDEQYLWKIDSMMLIDDLVKNYFSAEKELLIPATKEYPDNYNNIDLGV